MDRQKATKASELLGEIEEAEDKLELFEKTKEFCEINFKGENGNEKKYSYSIDYCNKTLVSEIR